MFEGSTDGDEIICAEGTDGVTGAIDGTTGSRKGDDC